MMSEYTMNMYDLRDSEDLVYSQIHVRDQHQMPSLLKQLTSRMMLKKYKMKKILKLTVKTSHVQW